MKLKRLTNAFLGFVFVFIVASCKEEDFGPSAEIKAPLSVPVFDQTGDVEIQVFHSTTTTNKNWHDSYQVNVADDYVLIGGGAWTEGVSEGAYLTESRPSTNKRTWIASSKDHGGRPDPHKLHVYAIGLKLNGLTRDQLASHITIISSAASALQAHPTNFKDMPTDYHLIGGGAEVIWTGSGNLLTASYPDGNRWKVASKDHLQSSPAKIIAWAIGIKKQIPGFGTILRHVNSPSASYVGTGVDTELSYSPVGYVVSCPGALIDYNGSGRMLMGMKPDLDLDFTQSISKDHVNASSGELYNYVISLRKQ